MGFGGNGGTGGTGSTAEQNSALRARKRQFQEDRNVQNEEKKRSRIKQKEDDAKKAKRAAERKKKRNQRAKKKQKDKENAAALESSVENGDVQMEEDENANPNDKKSENELNDEVLKMFGDMIDNLTTAESDELKTKLKEHYIGLTSVGEDNEKHMAPVCVVCDRFIIDSDNMTWIKKETLMAHSKRLSRIEYECHNGLLPSCLKEQYTVIDEGLEDLLLSPRARRKESEGKYMCCGQCKDSLREHMLSSKVPPRHAIANEFVIGCIPDEILSEEREEITDVLAAMIAPVRPFIHVVSYSAGQSKTMKGTVTFFQNELTHTGSVLQHYLETGANSNVYCVMCGRFTPNQREIVAKRMKLDIDVFQRVVKWFIEKSGHRAFANLNPDMTNWPEPTVLGNESNDNNTDDEVDAEVESTVEGKMFPKLLDVRMICNKCLKIRYKFVKNEYETH